MEELTQVNYETKMIELFKQSNRPSKDFLVDYAYKHIDDTNGVSSKEVYSFIATLLFGEFANTVEDVNRISKTL